MTTTEASEKLSQELTKLKELILAESRIKEFVEWLNNLITSSPSR